MDDPDITMEEYIRLDTEKALRKGKVYNWETATCGKIKYDEDVHFLRFIEMEFPAYNMGNGDDKIDIKQSSGDLSIESLPNVLSLVTIV
ncbi:hypothetical protein Tco_0763023 [Tanacetum coccineum]